MSSKKHYRTVEGRSAAADAAAGVPANDSDVAIAPDGEAGTMTSGGIPLVSPQTPQPKPPPKSRRQRFLDLVDPRMIRVRKALHAVANMGNRAGYEYTPEEAIEIWDAIQEGIAEVKVAFSEHGPRQGGASWRAN